MDNMMRMMPAMGWGMGVVSLPILALMILAIAALTAFSKRLSEEFGRIMQMHDAEGKPLVVCEMEVTGVTHPELSAKALEIWNLPGPIQNAVLYHHAPASDPSAQGQEVTLSRVLDASNQYVNSIGVSILKKCLDCADGTLVESLGLPAEELQSVLADFKTEYEAMSAFFR